MNFSFLNVCAILIFSLLIFGCQQNANNEQNDTRAEELPQQNIPAPSANPEAISDDELRQFVSAAQQVQVLGQGIQQEMADAVQREGLDVRRYSEIQIAEQDPNQSADATPQEMAQYEKAFQSVAEIQQTAQQEMEERIEAEGLTIDRYQMIADRLQQDPALQQKFQTIQQEMN